MNRFVAKLIVGTITSLCLTVPLIAQVVFEEPATPAAGAPAAASAAGPTQPAQPPGVQPPVQPAAGPAPYRTFGGGRATAVINPPSVAGGRGGIMMSAPAQIGFSFAGGPGHDDPEAEKLSRAEHELNRQTHELMAKYAETEDNQVREKAKAQLREMLAKQFELQNEFREMELKRIEERLGKLREQLKRRTDARDQIVDQRLQQLVSEAEGLGWTGPGGTNDFIPGRSGFFAPSPARPRVAR